MKLRWIDVVTCAVAVACLAGVAAVSKMPPVPGKRVVQLSAPGFYSEPSVAIDERDPLHAVAAYQVGPVIAYTNDGGRTWLQKNLWTKRYRVEGDVAVAYARHHAYLCYIAFDKLGSDQYWAHGATRNAIEVRRSPDGGKTWNPSAVAVIAHEGHPSLFEDKPIVVADDTNSRYSGNLYVGWTEFRLADAQIVLSRSTDGGASWSRPMRISTHDGTPRDDNGTVEGFDGAIDADGVLYAVWQDGPHIIFTSSMDGGKTFAPSVPILDIPSANFPLTGFTGRTSNGFPQIGIDPRTHVLYVAWSDTRDGDSDVFVASSNDRGVTWSDPVRVNDDAIHNGADHFYDWMSVDRATGDVYVIFYDRRADPENERAVVALARSTDGGKTFTNYAWTNVPFDPAWQFIGDYNALAAYAGHVYGVWTEAKTIPRTARRTMTMRQIFKSRTYVRLGEAKF